MAAGSSVSNAAKRTRAPTAIGGGHAASSWLPLTFIVVGLTALGVAATVSVLHPALWLLPYPHPQVVALAHLWLPGFLLTATLGAMYQLTPVILGVPLRCRPVTGWIHFGLHGAGLVLLIGGMAAGRFDLVGLGGASLTGGVLLFASSIGRTFVDSPRRDVVAWSFPLAAGWLAATVLAGVALAINRRWPFLPVSPVSLLRAHAHLGLVGFFVTLLQGATFQLVPMFTLGELRRPRTATAGLIVSQVALIVLVVGLSDLQAHGTLVGAALMGVGLALTGAALAATLQSRRRRKLEPGVLAFAVGAVGLGLAALVGVGLLLVPHPSVSAVTAYGIIIVPGGFGLMVPGMLCKIIPFLVWMRRYGPRVGREPVPAATTLSSPRLEQSWLLLQLTATATLILGVMIQSTPLTVVGTWLLAAAIGCFLANVGRVLRHLCVPSLAARGPLGRTGNKGGADPSPAPLSPENRHDLQPFATRN